GHRRQSWFECSCCPPNIARTIASITGYFYTVADDAIQVHLYGQGTAAVFLPNGRSVRLRQQTRYPWQGDVAIEADGDGEVTLAVRTPAWCGEGATVEVNGAPAPDEVRPGTYLPVRRTWRTGDTVRLHFPIAVNLVEAHPRIPEDGG